MKKILLYFIMILTAIPFAAAEEQSLEKQRYVVASKKGKSKFVEVENVDGKWKYVGTPPHYIYLENGIEFEAFEIGEDKSLNYPGTKYLYDHAFIAEYEGKYYVVISPYKGIKPVDDNGKLTSDLGWRNYLSNTIVGDFYRTWTPGIIGFACALLSAIFLFISQFKGSVPMIFRWGFAVPLCVITVLELGAFLSVGVDAQWWVDPEDVGYWIATPMLIPYSIVAVMMIFSIKYYGWIGKLDNPANIVVRTLLIIGIGLTVISVIFVISNFMGAILTLIGAAWLFKGNDYKDAAGNTINSGPLGTYKTDRFGNTTRIR